MQYATEPAKAESQVKYNDFPDSENSKAITFKFLVPHGMALALQTSRSLAGTHNTALTNCSFEHYLQQVTEFSGNWSIVPGFSPTGR